MTDFYGTSRSILTSMKTLILENRMSQSEELRRIVTLQLGVFSPVTVFPAVAIVPLSKTVVSWYSEHTTRVKRVYSLEAFCRGTDSDSTRKNANEILLAVVDLFKHSRTFDVRDGGGKQTYSIDVDLVRLNQTDEGGVVSKATAQITTIGREQLVTSRDVTSSLEDDPSVELLSDRIVNRLSVELPVGKVAYVGKGSEMQKVVMKFPAVLVHAEEESESKFETGRDRKKVSYTISVWMKMVPSGDVLLSLVDLADCVETVLIRNASWSGRAVDSQVTNEEFFGGDAGEGVGYMYEVRFTYVVEVARLVSFI